jgi:hypothetical protein
VLERDGEVNTNIRDEFFEMLRATNLDHKEPSVLVCFYEEKPMSVAGKTFFVSRILFCEYSNLTFSR